MKLIDFEKDDVRRMMRQARNALDPQWREAASRQIAARLGSWTTLSSLKVAHCYLAWRSEVATGALIEQFLQTGKRVVAPKVEALRHELQHCYILGLNDVQSGAFGILEPDPTKCEPANIHDLQFVIIPGVAFDRNGNRLGSGHGYYDRFLAQTSALRIGLGFGMQIIDAVPVGGHDQKMDFVVTEGEIIVCTAR